MLLKKARGDLQLEEQEAALEKSKFIEEKVKETNVDSLNKTQLIKLCEELHEQLQAAEGDKFDLEIKVKRRDLQVGTSFFLLVYTVSFHFLKIEVKRRRVVSCNNLSIRYITSTY